MRNQRIVASRELLRIGRRTTARGTRSANTPKKSSLKRVTSACASRREPARVARPRDAVSGGHYNLLRGGTRSRRRMWSLMIYQDISQTIRGTPVVPLNHLPPHPAPTHG